MSALPVTHRRARIERQTGETTVALDLTLDPTPGAVPGTIVTGVAFLDHMLDAVARHGHLGLDVRASGDAAMDPHHTVEDVGICLGLALKQALGDRTGIARYGHAYAPLDEALARVVVDCSGRPYTHVEGVMPEPLIGTDFAASLVEEFWRAVATNAGLTMHVDLLRARNAHHAAEAIFKAAALALRAAVAPLGDPDRVPSTKGMLA